MQTVTWEVVDPESAPGEYGSKEEPSPYVQMSSPNKHLQNMLDKDALVIPKETIKIRAEYPLDDEFIFELKSDAPEGFKRAELARKVCQIYHHIYQVESETAPDPGRAAPNLLNRGASHGEYGVWGHDLEDLVLSGVEYNEEDDVWDLAIDS